MNVQVGHRLPRRLAGVDSDIVAVRRMRLFDQLLYTVDRIAQRLLLLCCRLEPGHDMAFRDDQRVSGRDRELIPNRQRRFGLDGLSGLPGFCRKGSFGPFVFPIPKTVFHRDFQDQ